MSDRDNVRLHQTARRTFLTRTAAVGGALMMGSSGWLRAAPGVEVHPWLRAHQQRSPLAERPVIRDVEHVTLHRSPATYCGHPRQCLFHYSGSREIIVGHNHAPCRYQDSSDVAHDLGGYHSRAKMLLQRSLDGGKTWPEDQSVVVYDETMPAEKKRQFLYPNEARREPYDMFRPESVFFFGRTYLPERRGVTVCFALRSPDQGRTWERVPTIVRHPQGERLWVHKDCHPVLRMPDGKTLLAGMSVAEPGGPGIYASTDHGLSWRFLSRPAVDQSGTGRFSYVGVLLLPGGVLQCYYLHISTARDYAVIDGIKNAICMSESGDGGRTWSEPAPIVGKGGQCWKELGDRDGGSWVYRSPWPMLLKDGRILVVYARRRPPFGIGGILSADRGKTFSHEFVIRAGNASNDDLGYPVGCQLEDGQIFIAYYYNEPGKGYLNAVRYIAGSFFRIASPKRPASVPCRWPPWQPWY